MFVTFLVKVKKLLISKREVNTNLSIAVAGSAGYPSSSIALGDVAIFQVS